MTSLRSYSALPRDMSADRMSDRYCDRISELPMSSAFVGVVNGGNSIDSSRLYQSTSTTQGGGSPRAATTITSMPYAVSAFCLRERDPSLVSLQALSRGPASVPAPASPDTAALVRSRSVDHEFMCRAAGPPYPSPPRSASTRFSRHDSLVVELQTRVDALGRECCALRVELERTRDQLQASAHSVRVFWSPELKRERALRKDESARLAIVTERLRLLLRSTGQVTDHFNTAGANLISDSL